MRTRRIITLIVIVAVIALLAIVLATVFSVRSVYVACYDQEGNAITVSEDMDIAAAVLEEFGGSNILTLSKDTVLEWINDNYPQLHALAVVNEFPNTLVVHIVEREAVYSIEVGAVTVQIDSFGYVVETSELDYTLLDITSAFDVPVSVYEVGQQLQFDDETNDNRLAYIITTVNTIWQLQYNYSDIAWLVDSIKFSSDNSVMTITTQSGAIIVVYEPTTDLNSRLIDAFSVYANDTLNLQVEGAVISILENGDIHTSLD